MSPIERASFHVAAPLRSRESSKVMPPPASRERRLKSRQSPVLTACQVSLQIATGTLGGPQREVPGNGGEPTSVARPTFAAVVSKVKTLAHTAAPQSTRLGR